MEFLTYKDFLGSLHILHGKGQTFSRPYAQAFDVLKKSKLKTKRNRRQFRLFAKKIKTP